ncbi:hypothetical protein BDK51DRAFT_41353 [Blyttiomyces helicus]|uniref:Uncharacterized protein n=1 Tax=Blyttiomyces helicus TaxID=388810 RepID=A0A4P9WHN6_9FUNG|nr:hypothetical protein BDK51DRAFT_41353 [Blyttiomyces helicus]|eukprot:RKO91465.1 hypothetical protein BDK51DRAFT_41353 [Blyttiomyces helicus]
MCIRWGSEGWDRIGSDQRGTYQVHRVPTGYKQSDSVKLPDDVSADPQPRSWLHQFHLHDDLGCIVDLCQFRPHDRPVACPNVHHRQHVVEVRHHVVRIVKRMIDCCVRQNHPGEPTKSEQQDERQREEHRGRGIIRFDLIRSLRTPLTRSPRGHPREPHPFSSDSDPIRSDHSTPRLTKDESQNQQQDAQVPSDLPTEDQNPSGGEQMSKWSMPEYQRTHVKAGVCSKPPQQFPASKISEPPGAP